MCCFFLSIKNNMLDTPYLLSHLFFTSFMSVKQRPILVNFIYRVVCWARKFSKTSQMYKVLTGCCWLWEGVKKTRVFNGQATLKG